MSEITYTHQVFDGHDDKDVGGEYTNLHEVVGIATAWEGDLKVGVLEHGPDGFIWGIDVLPEYRRKGIATGLAKHLKEKYGRVCYPSSDCDTNSDEGNAWLQSIKGMLGDGQTAFDRAWSIVKGFQDILDSGGRYSLYGGEGIGSRHYGDDPIEGIEYALGQRGRHGDERFQYNIELPQDQALELMGEPTGVKNRMRRGGWRGTKDRFNRSIDAVNMAFGGNRYPLQGESWKANVPLYPSTIGSRLGGTSSLPEATRAIPRRDIYANYRDAMLPTVRQAIENESDDWIPVAGTMINQLSYPHVSVGTLPGFEGNELGLASNLLALQDIGRIPVSGTPEAQSMYRRLREIPGISPDKERGMAVMDEPRTLVDAPHGATKGIGELAGWMKEHPETYEEQYPFLREGFAQRWG